MSLASLEFEIPRRVVLLKKNTRMPDLTQLGVTGDPNVLDPVRAADYTTGEFLLDNAPPMTMYLDVDSDDVWRRTTAKTWVKIFNDSGVEGGSSSGTDSNYNAHNEYALASISGDNSLHFEDGHTLIDETGVAILFETYLEADENAYAVGLENQLFLEGMEPLIMEDGEGLLMETGENIPNLLDNYFADPTFEEVAAAITDNNTSRLRLIAHYHNPFRYNVTFGGSRECLVEHTNTWIFLQDIVTHGFTIVNRSVMPWSEDNPVYIIFPNTTIVRLENAGSAYSFRPSGFKRWTGTNMTTGVTFEINLDD